MVNFVVNYFYNGVGNGNIHLLANATHDDPLGTGEVIMQCQESGRDQGHAQMDISVVAHLCQMAYTLYQCNKSVGELDFFTAEDYAVMKVAEYVALSNLTDGSAQDNSDGSWIVQYYNVPFNTYEYCVGCSCSSGHSATHTTISTDDRGGQLRPGWEILYMHYANTLGLSSGYIYTKQAADKNRPECGADGQSRYGTNSGAFDQLGWNTLMLYQE